MRFITCKIKPKEEERIKREQINRSRVDIRKNILVWASLTWPVDTSELTQFSDLSRWEPGFPLSLGYSYEELLAIIFN